MKRAVEIINSLRIGIERMLHPDQPIKVSCLRMFNFEKNRVSLRMELVGEESINQPMGMIDVVEFPTNDKGASSCNCLMTELQTGKTEKLLLHLQNKDDKNVETKKVFNFFRKVLDIPDPVNNSVEIDDSSVESHPASSETNLESLYPPSDGTFPQNPRGAR